MGFLTNPIAGLGGRPGLKGSDDATRVRSLLSGLAFEETNAFVRGFQFFSQLEPKGKVLVSAPGVLGEDVLKAALACGGPLFEVVREPGWDGALGETTREDTIRFARRLLRAEPDLLVFVGGDGTAVDLGEAVADRVPVLGIPGGVKMFSGVFAQSAPQAALIVNGLAPAFATRIVDIVDLDEASYQAGAWRIARHATARVPDAEGVPAGKGGSFPLESESEADLAEWFRQSYRPGTTYVLGAGATVGSLKRALGGGTPLGVDVYRDGAFVVVDGSEASILEGLVEGGPTLIIVSPTGTQGCILGRGTAQISPDVLERVGVGSVVVVATPGKLLGLRELFVDTGDPDLDRQFPAYVRVRTDPLTEKVFRVRTSPLPRSAPFGGPHG